ncbi:MAG: hypothetical protein AAF202_05705, partial [Pseudomonadota bacterium]
MLKASPHRLAWWNASLALMTIGLGLVFSTPAEAILGACGNRHLPSNKVRKLRRNSIRLECAAG